MNRVLDEGRATSVRNRISAKLAELKGEKVVEAATPSTERDYLLSGDTGAAVKTLQSELKQAGFLLSVDGIFGKGTETAVKAFQRGNGLVVDGVWGKASQAKLNAILANLNKAPVVKPAVPSKPAAKPAANKKGDEIMDLKQWQKEEMRDIYKKARDKGIFKEDRHEKEIMAGTKTVSDAIYLQTVIAGAALNGGKRIE